MFKIWNDQYRNIKFTVIPIKCIIMETLEISEEVIEINSNVKTCRMFYSEFMCF